jgi:hypothetical protein
MKKFRLCHKEEGWVGRTLQMPKKMAGEANTKFPKWSKMRWKEVK